MALPACFMRSSFHLWIQQACGVDDSRRISENLAIRWYLFKWNWISQEKAISLHFDTSNRQQWETCHFRPTSPWKRWTEIKSEGGVINKVTMNKSARQKDLGCLHQDDDGFDHALGDLWLPVVWGWKLECFDDIFFWLHIVFGTGQRWHTVWHRSLFLQGMAGFQLMIPLPSWRDKALFVQLSDCSSASGQCVFIELTTWIVSSCRALGFQYESSVSSPTVHSLSWYLASFSFAMFKMELEWSTLKHVEMATG